jgi:hypothetical protein
MGRLFVIITLLLLALTGHAQEEAELVNDTLRTHEVVLSADSASVNTDQATLNMDSIARSPEEIPIKVDTTQKVKLPRDWSTWKPNPQRALWLALVLPGAGQIYNRKFWKLPIFYGGFLGCIYALSWNNMMYKDYSQAYLDIMDDDPTTASYNKFLHLGVQITSANEERYKEIFKGRKDKYRRWRDMSIFVMIGIYALSVIDAYVDAELSEFDISKDLSLEIHPTVMPNRGGGNPIQAQSVGFSCFLNF